jgi:hypothetical protein
MFFPYPHSRGPRNGHTSTLSYSLLLDGSGNSTDPNVITTTTFLAEATGFSGSHTIDRLTPNGGSILFGYIGTGLGAYLTTISGQNPTTAFAIYIDGVQVNPSYNADGAFGEVTLATGQTHGLHTCEIIFRAVNAFIERTAGGGVNPSFVVHDTRGRAAAVIPPGRGPIARTYADNNTKLRIDGGYYHTTAFSLWDVMVDLGVAAQARIKTTITQAPGAISVFTLTGAYQVSLDGGVTYGAGVLCDAALSNTYQWTKIIDNIPAGTYDVRIINDSTTGNGLAGAENNNPYAFMVSNGTFTTGTYPNRTLVGVYGDSLWLGWTTPADVSPTHYLDYLADVGIVVRSVGGSTVVGRGQTSTSDITGLSPAPVKVIVPYGGNDDVSTPSAQTTFQNAYQTMIHALRTGLPSTTFYCFGITPSLSQTPTVRALTKSLIQAAIAADGSPANVVFCDIEGVLPEPTNDASYFTDGTHYSAKGGLAVATFAKTALGL